MLQFIHINPDARLIRGVAAHDFHAAWNTYCHGQRDHGALGNHLHIAVYEYGLLDPDWAGGYFSLHTALFAGGALVYRVDEAGSTIDTTAADLRAIGEAVRFYADVAAVEEAIKLGWITRPDLSVSGVVVWQWNKGKTLDQAKSDISEAVGTALKGAIK
jgi:hypothetical protein